MSPVPLSPEEIQRIYQTKTYLLNHLHQKITVRALSRNAALQEAKLNEGFVQLFGMPAGQYLLEARKLLGSFLLQHTDKPIKEVASLSGYRYTKSFMAAMKKRFGKTALQLRQGR